MNELIIAGIVLLIVAVLIAVLLHEMRPRNAPWLSEHNDPDPDCPVCGGSGVLNSDDGHLECECPCTDRWYF